MPGRTFGALVIGPDGLQDGGLLLRRSHLLVAVGERAGEALHLVGVVGARDRHLEGPIREQLDLQPGARVVGQRRVDLPQAEVGMLE